MSNWAQSPAPSIMARIILAIMLADEGQSAHLHTITTSDESHSFLIRAPSAGDGLTFEIGVVDGDVPEDVQAYFILRDRAGATLERVDADGPGPDLDGAIQTAMSWFWPAHRSA